MEIKNKKVLQQTRAGYVLDNTKKKRTFKIFYQTKYGSSTSSSTVGGGGGGVDSRMMCARTGRSSKKAQTVYWWLSLSQFKLPPVYSKRKEKRKRGSQRSTQLLQYLQMASDANASFWLPRIRLKIMGTAIIIKKREPTFRDESLS